MFDEPGEIQIDEHGSDELVENLLREIKLSVIATVVCKNAAVRTRLCGASVPTRFDQT
jgi:hypothetical protein